MSKYDELTETVEMVRLGVLKADPRFVTEPMVRLAVMCNGCGAGKLGSRVIPDTAWGLLISPACFIHDFDYSMGSTAADRKFADDRFLSNMNRLIRRGNVLLRAPRFTRARTYYTAVRVAGEGPFWSGKEINIVTLGDYHGDTNGSTPS